MVGGLRVKAFSNAEGRSCAPGGFVFLLGLPCDVLMGLRKLSDLEEGVAGRGLLASLAVPLFFSFPPGKKLDMKLAMADYLP